MTTMNRTRAVLICVAAVLAVISVSKSDAATNLAVICTAGASDGSARSACTGTRYDRPTPASLVRSMSTNTWRTLSALSPTDTIEVCSTDIPPGPSAPDGSPCTNWPVLAVSAVTLAVPVNTTGTIYLRWDAPLTNTDGTPLTDLGGFWIWSAAKGKQLGHLLRVPSAAATTATLTGYSAGEYDFAVAAYNLAGTEGQIGNPITVAVQLEKKTPGAVNGLRGTTTPTIPAP